MFVDPNIDPPVMGRHNGFDVYPMPMFMRMETRDLATTVQWYRDALAFAVMFEMPGMAHLRRKKFQDVLLLESVTGGEPLRGLAIAFEAEGEIDEIWRRALGTAAVGHAKVEGEPQVMPWNSRELRVVDPDGRALVFHERANDAEAAARMSAILKADEK
jgi:catechol 2,3-dioxygenase-like lactoylglutathione lyase family enzyme